MEILDPKKSYTKAKIPAGTFIAVQGDPQDRIFILHSGFCEALYLPPDAGDPRSSEAIEKGIRIGFAQGQTIVGASRLFQLTEGYQSSLRTALFEAEELQIVRLRTARFVATLLSIMVAEPTWGRLATA